METIAAVAQYYSSSIVVHHLFRTLTGIGKDWWENELSAPTRLLLRTSLDAFQIALTECFEPSKLEALRYLTSERYTFQDAAIYLAKLANIPEQSAVHFAYQALREGQTQLVWQQTNYAGRTLIHCPSLHIYDPRHSTIATASYVFKTSHPTQRQITYRQRPWAAPQYNNSNALVPRANFAANNSSLRSCLLRRSSPLEDQQACHVYITHAYNTEPVEEMELSLTATETAIDDTKTLLRWLSTRSNATAMRFKALKPPDRWIHSANRSMYYGTVYWPVRHIDKTTNEH